MSELEKLKIALNITDNERDALLTLFLSDASDFLRLRLNLTGDTPAALQPIIRGACVVKFNKLNNEGMRSYSQNGESITFNADDFAPFKEEIKAFKDANPDLYAANKAWLVNPYEI